MPLLELSFASKEDSLSVRHFAVHEEISGFFEVSILARSPLDEIDLEAIVGQGAGFALDNDLGTPGRVWTGICSHMELVQVESGPETRALSTYFLTIVPALWRTTLRRNNRIFQHLTIPAIVEKVLAEWQIEPELRLTAQYLEYEYRAQYDETDFAFVSRLLEEAGIAYFFTHSGSKSVLLLSDQPTAGDARPPLTYVDHPNQAAALEYISKVKLAQRVKPGRFTVRDFDLRNQLDYQLFIDAQAGASGGRELPYEQYVYEPGAFWFEPGQASDTPVADDKGVARTNPKEGSQLVQRNLDAERRARRALAFETNVIDLSPGTLLTVAEHPRKDITGKKLLVIESWMEGAPGERWSIKGDAVYTDVTYRPQRRTPRPRVQGVQSAVVVGPPGEEIYVDELGRVRVQLHWDREGKYDDDSACWIRVSQGWSGSGYGFLNLPRVGQEVLVDFFEGDPDRPVITGRVFSYTRSVLYKLPDNKTKSGWKSESSPGAGGFNELSFEDATGREVVHFQAQKDFTEIVKNDQVSTVLNDRSASVTVNDSMTVGGSQSFTVGVNQSHTIAKYQANDVGESRTSKIAHADTIDAGDVITGTVGPGVGYAYSKSQTVLFTNGVSSLLLTPKGMYLDAKGDITINAGGTLKLSGKQVVFDGKPNVYFNHEAKRLRLQTRLALIAAARKKAEDGPDRDALLAAADRLSRNNVAVEHARLAADVYNVDQTSAPEGWKRLQTWSSPSGFYAAAYKSDIDGSVVVAYRGTVPTTWSSWKANLAQGVGLPSAQYAEAAMVGREAAAQYGPNVQTTGHSLGGALASTGAMAAGLHADTFNAAGVNRMSDLYYGLDRSDAKNITNYTVEGDILTGVQHKASWVMPQAVGKQISLPSVRMEKDAHGDTILDEHGQPTFTPSPPEGLGESVDRHSRFLDAIEFQKTQDVNTITRLLG